VMDKVIEETPYWVPFEIPANYYKGQADPVKTYASWNIVAIHEGMDPDLIYDMTRLLFENKEDLLAVRANMQTMTPENIKYLLIPLHEGSQRYYREIGVCD